ncbi:DUF4252 domain-containing protein [Maribellus mangrovi]|uniref:DUF4252 domain-containing protein n=1 Tax=Maribellus mangrovi TaxID=3133146 RepID=UPI0030EDD384
MKKYAFLLVVLIVVLTSCSYEPGVSEAYNKYRFKDGVVTVSVPGWLIHLAAGFTELDETERELLESIDKVKVIAVDDDELNRRIDLHEEFYQQIHDRKEYEELLVVRDEDESVTIFGIMDDESVIREMLILVGGDDNAMVYIKGEIRPEILNDKIDLTNPDRFLSLNF